MKPLDSYSHQFREVIEEASLAGEFFIPVEGDTKRERANQQISLRTQLYAFMKAIRVTAEKDPANKWAMTYSNFAQQTGVRFVEKNGEEGVELYPKKKGTTSILLGKALLGRKEKEEKKTVEEEMTPMEKAVFERLQRLANPTGKTDEEIRKELEGPGVTSNVKYNELLTNQKDEK